MWRPYHYCKMAQPSRARSSVVSNASRRAENGDSSDPNISDSNASERTVAVRVAAQRGGRGGGRGRARGGAQATAIRAPTQRANAGNAGSVSEPRVTHAQAGGRANAPSAELENDTVLGVRNRRAEEEQREARSDTPEMPDIPEMLARERKLESSALSINFSLSLVKMSIEKQIKGHPIEPDRWRINLLVLNEAQRELCKIQAGALRRENSFSGHALKDNASP